MARWKTLHRRAERRRLKALHYGWKFYVNGVLCDERAFVNLDAILTSFGVDPPHLSRRRRKQRALLARRRAERAVLQ